MIVIYLSIYYFANIIFYSEGNRLESVASTISPFAWSSGTPATNTDTSDISGIKQFEDSIISRGSQVSQCTSEEATSDYMARMKAVLDTSAESNNDTMAEGKFFFSI